MGGSKGKSDSETLPAGTFSFIPALLAQAFLGTGIGLNDQGFRSSSPGKGNVSRTDASLDPNQLLSSILDLTNPDINQGVGAAENLLGLGSQFAQGAAQVGAGALGTLQEGLDTGFQVDLDPIIESRQRDFFQNIVPGIQQSTVFANEGGAFGTDLTGQLFDAGKDLSVELGGLETQLQSDAAQRRADLTGISGTLLGQLQDIPFQGGFAALDLGEQLALQGTEGGRQAQILQLLAGINPSQPIQGQKSSSKTSGGGV